MGIYLNSGNTGFERALNSKIYVDKTDMIALLMKRINTEQSCICMSRPRRFGKSVTANMIAAYFDKSCDSRMLFEGRKLGNAEHWDRYLNQFNVIKLDIADFRARTDNAESALEYISDVLFEELSEAFPDVALERKREPAGWLALIHEKKGEQFVIIIDEWDCLFRDDAEDKNGQEKYISFLRSLFKGDNSKRFLALAYITGILPVKRYRSESALNNFSECTMLSPKEFAPYIGFTTEEVKKLCSEYDMDYEQALEWYDGYNLGEHEHICGANSVALAMYYRNFESYWSQTIAFDSLKGYITLNYEGLKDDIIQMIGGQKVKVRTRTFQNDTTSIGSKDDVMTLLIHLGYLAYDADTQLAYIPNKEVREYFEDTLEAAGWDGLVEAIEDSRRLLAATIEGNTVETARMIERCHGENTSIIKYNDENSLAACLAIAYYSARSEYMIIREMPAGYGFADMVFLPKRNVTKPAMIVELKWNKNADTAISQIREKKYVQALKGYEGEVLLVGISYDKNGKDEKKHFCVIERIHLKKINKVLDK